MTTVMHRCINMVLALAGIACSLSAQAAYTFRVVDYPGATVTQLWGINDSGQVVGQAFSDPGATLLVANFLYDTATGTFTTLPMVLPATPPVTIGLMGINDAGVLVGSAYPTDAFVTGLICHSTCMTAFAYPAPSPDTYFRAVSNSGLVTGYAQDDDQNNNVGFIFDSIHGTYANLPFVGSRQVIPQGINGRGQVVGTVRLPDAGLYSGYPKGHYSFLREANGAITLFQINGGDTRARGINDADRITGFTFDENLVASGFVGALNGSSFQPLNVPNAANTLPQAINNSEQIVGFTDVDGFVASSNKDDCKNGGWKSLLRADGLAFKNQGDCIQYINTGK